MRMRMSKFYKWSQRILQHKSFLLGITLFGILARVGLVFTLRHNTIFSDESQYAKIGISIWIHFAFAVPAGLTAYRPPGQPAFIALIYSLVGENTTAVKVAEAVLLGALPFLCALLSRTLGFGIAAANLSALLITVHPGLAYSATTLYPTVLTAVTLTAGVAFCAFADSGSTTAPYIGAISLALAALATTTFAPLSFLIASYYAITRKLRLACIIGLIGTLPTLLWVSRNHERFGQWTVATNGGVNLYLGANDDATPMSGNQHGRDEIDTVFHAGIDELHQDHRFAGYAADWIHRHPIRYAELSVERAILIVDSVGNPVTKGFHSGLAAHIAAWGMLPFVLLGFVGLAVYWRKPAGIFSIMAIGLVVLSSSLTLMKPRFRFPCDPLIATFASAVIYSAYSSRAVRLKSPDTSPSGR